MEEKDIKYFAKSYATKYYSDESGSSYSLVAEDAYVAGAEFVNHQVKRLDSKIESLKVLIDWYEKLLKRTTELNDPWISIEDELPAEGHPVYVKMPLVMTAEDDGMMSSNVPFDVAYMTKSVSSDKLYWTNPNTDEPIPEEVTHWKPIIDLETENYDTRTIL